MTSDLLRILGIVFATWLCGISLHVLSVWLGRVVRHPLITLLAWVSCVGLLVGGPVLVWHGLRASLASSVTGAAVLLYLAGCVAYVETRSLLSRGYSLRILVDLLSHGRGLAMEQLKASYGNGWGVRGMLAKRLTTLACLRLLAFDGARVGPLTPLGLLCAWWSRAMRRLLRLELVG